MKNEKTAGTAEIVQRNRFDELVRFIKTAIRGLGNELDKSPREFRGEANCDPIEGVTAVWVSVPHQGSRVRRIVLVTDRASLAVGPSGFNCNDGETWGNHDWCAITHQLVELDRRVR